MCSCTDRGFSRGTNSIHLSLFPIGYQKDCEHVLGGWFVRRATRSSVDGSRKGKVMRHHINKGPSQGNCGQERVGSVTVFGKQNKQFQYLHNLAGLVFTKPPRDGGSSGAMGPLAKAGTPPGRGTAVSGFWARPGPALPTSHCTEGK